MADCLVLPSHRAQAATLHVDVRAAVRRCARPLGRALRRASRHCARRRATNAYRSSRGRHLDRRRVCRNAQFGYAVAVGARAVRRVLCCDQRDWSGAGSHHAGPAAAPRVVARAPCGMRSGTRDRVTRPPPRALDGDHAQHPRRATRQSAAPLGAARPAPRHLLVSIRCHAKQLVGSGVLARVLYGEGSSDTLGLRTASDSSRLSRKAR